MTDRLELIASIRRCGAFIILAGEGLNIRPAKLVPVKLVQQVRELKPQLVSILAGTKSECPHCGGSVVHDETFDHYTNRICVGCGRWLRCLPPVGDSEVTA